MVCPGLRALETTMKASISSTIALNHFNSTIRSVRQDPLDTDLSLRIRSKTDDRDDAHWPVVGNAFPVFDTTQLIITG